MQMQLHVFGQYFVKTRNAFFHFVSSPCTVAHERIILASVYFKEQRFALFATQLRRLRFSDVQDSVYHKAATSLIASSKP